MAHDRQLCGPKNHARLLRKVVEARSFASEFNLQANERTSASFRNAKKSGKKVVAVEIISSYTTANPGTRPEVSIYTCTYNRI